REDERDVIFANCANQVLMPRCGPKTTEYFGSRLGTRVAIRQSQSSSFTRRDGLTWQTSSQPTDVPVFGHAEMASPPGGDYGAIIHSYSLSTKPVLVDLTRQDLVTR
ncbi:MAG: hypothetical protein QOG97_3334, partial [Acidimicrobiaceae bacterium]|nr:hypothetical protein [Acidimicrobiaceae bacterium]